MFKLPSDLSITRTTDSKRMRLLRSRRWLLVMGMKELLIRSLLVAGLVAVMPPLLFVYGYNFGGATYLERGFWWSLLVVGVIWSAFLGRAWYLYGAQGLWLLVGAPLIMFWPCLYWLILWGCLRHSNCP